MAKTVLITGASSGIGKATALWFKGRGWNVAATMRTPSAAPWASAPPQCIAPALDVTDPASIEAALTETMARFGAIDVVVNNAGYGLVGPFEASTPAQIERQFATNVFGVMNVCRAALPHFRQRGSGLIINVASMGGRITFPLYSLYHATKWAVDGFTEALHFELAPLGIRVKIIEPGPIRTDFYDRSMDIMSKEGLHAYDAYVAKVMPAMQAAGAAAPGPDIVARAIWKAATDGSSRLRYTPNAGAILALRRLLPEPLFYGLVRRVVGA